MGESDLLRELHEAYVWKVNAAVAEGRMDLVWQFSDQYTDEALDLMATLQTPGCGRPSATAHRQLASVRVCSAPVALAEAP